jgi:hypothetical protein
VDLVSARAFFFYCTRSCGCIEHPAFPAPSLFRRRENFLQNSGAWRREIAESCARHCERSEAIQTFDLAKTGLLRFARNDERMAV